MAISRDFSGNGRSQGQSTNDATPLVKTALKWAGIVLGVLLLIHIFDPFYSVPTGSRGVVTRFGKIVGIEPEGLVILPPWETLTNFSIRAEADNINNAEGSTRDMQPVWTSLTVRYAIDPTKVGEVYEKYTHNGDLSNYVDTATQEVFKAVTARYNAAEIIDQRAAVSEGILAALQAKLAIYGAHVITVDMRDFKFQASYMDAINQKVDQQQLMLAAQNKLQTVKAEQQQKVEIATAEAQAREQQADGQAYARVALAKATAQSTEIEATAKAQAIRVQAQALAQNENILALKKIEVQQTWADRWDGNLPKNIYGGAPIPLVNLPAPTGK